MKQAMRNFKKPVINERGQLTLDFIFSSVLILSTASILISLCLAFSFVEVLQYVSFSGARAYFVADVTPDAQKQNSLNKMTSLISTLPVLKSKDNTWIKVNPLANAVGDYKGFFGSAVKDRPFHSGVQISFELGLLKFKIPFVGSTLNYGGEEAPTATVGSFLGREPSFSECQEFMRRSLQAIYSRDGKYATAGSKGIAPAAFEPILDNGC